MTSQNDPPPLFLNLAEVVSRVGLSSSTIRRRVRDGSFPPPRQVSERRVAWLASEVREWAENRPAAGDSHV